MATFKGSEGSIAVGANAIAEVLNFSVNEQAAMIEDTALGDTAKTFKSGTTEWSGSLECMFDDTDTNGQVALTVGASVTLNLYTEGTTTGDYLLTGTALVESREVSNPGNDETTKLSVSFRGTGALSKTTV